MRVTSRDGTSIAFERVGDGAPLVMIDPAGGFHGLRPTAGLVPCLAERFAVYT